MSTRSKGPMLGKLALAVAVSQAWASADARQMAPQAWWTPEWAAPAWTRVLSFAQGVLGPQAAGTTALWSDDVQLLTLQGQMGSQATGVGQVAGAGEGFYLSTPQLTVYAPDGVATGELQVFGGQGGLALDGAGGGAGGSVTLVNALTGSGSHGLSLIQAAYGGHGSLQQGFGLAPATAGAGGQAMSVLDWSGSDALNTAFTALARGGNSGDALGGPAVAGGNAQVMLGVTAGLSTRLTGTAEGGRGSSVMSGQDGVGDGGRGGSASVFARLTGLGSTVMSILGGSGGEGAGAGQRGGDGASVSGTDAQWLGHLTGDSSLNLMARGGAGGDGHQGADGGAGGWIELLNPIMLTMENWVTATLDLQVSGGAGGIAQGAADLDSAAHGGQGGQARLNQNLWLEDRQFVSFSAAVRGGAGGGGLWGGNGAAGLAEISISGSTDNRLNLQVHGGNGGLASVADPTARGGQGGRAEASGQLSAANYLSSGGDLVVNAYGGAGGDALGGQAGHGGAAQASAGSSNVNSTTLLAVGGAGGQGSGIAAGGDGGQSFVNGQTSGRWLTLWAIGGQGGHGAEARGGQGGDALTQWNSSAWTMTGGGSSDVVASASGGHGGDAMAGLWAAQAGDGGAAGLQGASNGGLSVNLLAGAGGGNGGSSTWGNGGRGGTVTARVSSEDTDQLTQDVRLHGGFGGQGAGLGYAGGDGGDLSFASVVMNGSARGQMSQFLSLYGGGGGAGIGGANAGRGGDVTAVNAVRGTGFGAHDVNLYAQGGDGGLLAHADGLAARGGHVVLGGLLDNRFASRMSVNVEAIGGQGSDVWWDVAAPMAGQGGNATLDLTAQTAGPLSMISRIYGGRGGQGLYLPDDSAPGLAAGGLGGTASSMLSGVTDGAASVSVTSIAQGGKGGQAGAAAAAGLGGAAWAGGFGSSTTGDVVVRADARGGDGGNGADGVQGGAGASVSLINAVSGSTSGRLTLLQEASGGRGGDAGRVGSAAGRGASAFSSLSVTDHQASSVDIRAGAYGGWGNVGGNARALAQLSSTVQGAPVIASAEAMGGDALAGSGWQGGTASATSLASGLGVVSAESFSYSQRQAESLATASGGTSNTARTVADLQGPIGRLVAVDARVRANWGTAETHSGAQAFGERYATLANVAGRTAAQAQVLAWGEQHTVQGALGLATGQSNGTGEYSTSFEYFGGGVVPMHYDLDFTGTAGALGDNVSEFNFALFAGGQRLYSGSFDTWSAMSTYLQGADFEFTLPASNQGMAMYFSMNTSGLATQGSYGAFSFSLNGTAAPVPEPETWALWLAGLGALGWRTRRRQVAMQAA